MKKTYEQRLQLAQELDRKDELSRFRDEFHLPVQDNGQQVVYLVGNSLGLQPKRTSQYLQQVLDKWKKYAIRGHFQGDFPWMPYHEFLTEKMARLVGAQADEVVMMNSLTVNLHLMLATFYRPTRQRHKILIEAHAFPSDYQAVESQIQLHGYSAEASLLQVQPNPGTEEFELDSILETIEKHGHEIAVLLLPGVQYYTGQVFLVNAITEFARSKGIVVGFDLAHAAGNVQLSLHDWNVDFAVWCSYKYLNSGPGSVGGCFVHQRHATNTSLGRLAGWWGHDKATRFQMKNEFQAIPTAEGWQLSNPPILSLAAIRAALDVFDEAGGMAPLTCKSKLLTGYLRGQLENQLGDRIRIITPLEYEACQLSIEINFGQTPGRVVHKRLEQAGVETDWREPNVIRAAPVPLYNTFEDCFHFVEILKTCLED